MNETIYFLDIIKYTISGLIVFFAGWYFVRTYLHENNNQQAIELKKSVNQQILPLRLQAYERMILFLERINPSNMLVRLHVAGMSAREMQNLILLDIRAEYQHNIAQQLYISPPIWNVIKKVKEDTISMVNSAVHGLPEQASAIDLSKVILTHMTNLNEENPYDVALALIKQDVQQLF